MSGVGAVPAAILLAHTKVRVNPSGKSLALGIAEIDGGAKTLCILDEGVPSTGEKRVILRRRGDLFYAGREGDEPGNV
jgi:hypothetical protein